MPRKAPRRNVSQRSELLSDIREYGVNADTRELFLASVPGSSTDEEIGVDARMAEKFVQQMSFLEHQGGEPILVHVSTIGGEWEYGMAIYDRIAASRCVVTTLSHAHARSMSSIFIQAADCRVLMPNCKFLVHAGWLAIGGEYHHVVAEAEEAKREYPQMLAIYAEACQHAAMWKGKRNKKLAIMAYIDKQIRTRREWYLTARDAVEHGFADAVLGDEGFESIEALR